MVKPTNVAKKASNPSSDSTNQMPHMAGTNKPDGDEDEFEKVDSGESKPKVLTERSSCIYWSSCKGTRTDL